MAHDAGIPVPREVAPGAVGAREVRSMTPLIRSPYSTG
jgi:hypothetical protein